MISFFPGDFSVNFLDFSVNFLDFSVNVLDFSVIFFWISLEVGDVVWWDASGPLLNLMAASDTLSRSTIKMVISRMDAFRSV